MAEATLDAPLTLNPKTAAKIVVRFATLEFDAAVVRIVCDLVDSNGKIVEQRVVMADGASVATWVGEQEATVYQSLLTKLGVTATVAAAEAVVSP